MNIIIISGSIRKGRKSHDVAVALMARFHRSGHTQAAIIDLAAYDLPVLEEQYSEEGNTLPGLTDIQQKLDKADAIIFLSPEYHGSYSGALKNAVDYFSEEFKRKPIGVVSVGAGRMGGINASTEMQQLVLSLGAYPMPYKLLVSNVQHAFDDSGAVKDEFLSKSLDRFVSEFIWLAEAIRDKKLKS
ncbi:MAG: NAD(P)H-dependent oxidoreductase [Bacteroidetes bacterium]|nr:NAD(P)H-dependent oxidoreductase [Bacteroidota bacterium]